LTMGKTQGNKQQRSPRSPRGHSPRSPVKLQSAERRKWTKEEDFRLQQAIQKYGTKNWCVVAACIPDRHPKQCRERWINHLDPNITKGKISDAEWDIVLKTHVEQGNRWSEIAKLLPGRTPNQIKNYWHTMTRRALKKKREAEVGLDNQSSDEAVGDAYQDEEDYSSDRSPSPNQDTCNQYSPQNQWVERQLFPCPPMYRQPDYHEANLDPNFYFQRQYVPIPTNMPNPQMYDPFMGNQMQHPEQLMNTFPATNEEQSILIVNEDYFPVNREIPVTDPIKTEVMEPSFSSPYEDVCSSYALDTIIKREPMSEDLTEREYISNSSSFSVSMYSSEYADGTLNLPWDLPISDVI